MEWLFVILAIAFEVAATTSMKLSAGFTKLVPSVAMFVLYCASFGFLTLSLKRLEVSTVYALWSGLGTASIALIGVLAFQESMSWGKAVFLAMVIIGVVGLQAVGSSHA